MVPNMCRDESVAVVESAPRGNSFLPATFANCAASISTPLGPVRLSARVVGPGASRALTKCQHSAGITCPSPCEPRIRGPVVTHTTEDTVTCSLLHPLRLLSLPSAVHE